MKKMLLMLVAIATLGFVSCKKDSNDGNDLAGTTWICSEPGYQETMKFLPGGRVTDTWRYTDGSGSGSGDGSYTYTPPYITVTIAEDGYTFIYSGTVTGNTMNLTCYGEPYVFVKR